MQQLRYKIFSIWQGFCRINYISSYEGKVFSHCLQYDGNKIVFYFCSQDFEPQFESDMDISGRQLLFEKPIGDSELEIKVRQWIDNEI